MTPGLLFLFGNRPILRRHCNHCYSLVSEVLLSPSPKMTIFSSRPSFEPYGQAGNRRTYSRLVVAGADGNLRHLSKSMTSEECITNLRGQLTGHQGRVNGLTFCGDPHSDMGWRYVASVGGNVISSSVERLLILVADDKLLLIWDLYPETELYEMSRAPSSSPSFPSNIPCGPPAAWSMQLSRPLHTVLSHPDNSKEIVVSDDRGSIFIIDWRSDDDDRLSEGTTNTQRRIIAEYTDPGCLSAGLTSQLIHGRGPHLGSRMISTCK